ncbi:hypothetical protein QUF50_08310 [Thiotrichales bacterium HSG1]|nr:hypothetical protein [Thiotrichales bacterium HSG1]
MIKLNITSDEFVAILNELAKMIGIPLASNKIPLGKVDLLRVYEHDDFMRLLDELKNNELTETSEWFQAIQYLYQNEELQFFSESSTKESDGPVETHQDNVSKPAEKYQSTENDNISVEKAQNKNAQSSIQNSCPSDEKYKKNHNIVIHNILNPLIGANDKGNTVAVFLILFSPIATLLGLLIIYDLSWWKYIVYDLAISLGIAIFILTIGLIYDKKQLDLAKIGLTH